MFDLGVIQKGRRYFVIAMIVGSVVAMLFHIQWDEQHPRVEQISILFGLILILSGQRLRLAAAGDIAGRKYRSLVTSGIYSLMRHPLYVGNVLAGLGVALVVQSVTITALILTLYVPLYWIVINGEETQLLKVYGDRYAMYCSDVPRFIPRRPLTGLTRVSSQAVRSEFPNMIGLVLGILIFFALEVINERFDLVRLFI